MYSISRFIRPDDENIIIQIPKELRGKFVEIELVENNGKVSSVSAAEKKETAHAELELQMLDKMRNQLSVWDI